MKNQELKLFVGGYFDQRIFEGEEFCGKTPFDKNIDTYTLSEALELGFVESVIEWFEEDKEDGWDQLTEEEKIKAILNYTETDEIAGILYFNTEEEAEKYKNDVIKEIEEVEAMSTYKGTKQDDYGFYREVYTAISERLEEENTYIVNLVNNEGCNFDNGSFHNLEKAKEWAEGRGKNYTAYFKKNYDPDLNFSEEEFEIQY